MADKPTEILAKSVTLNDVNPSPELGPLRLFNFNLPAPSLITQALPDCPMYWTYERDWILSRAALYEGNWSSALSIAITQMASLSWSVESDIPLRVKQAQEMFHTVESGAGWIHFISKHLRDYLTCDNGAFIEVIRATSAYGSRILGLVHLDSKRCTRTGNPDIPVLYRDTQGNIHELKYYQVISLVDMPAPETTWNGIGLSAASRAYDAIQSFAYTEQFIKEQLTGSNPNNLEFLSGISDQQLKKAVKAAKAESEARGMVLYRGAAIIPMLDLVNMQHVSIPLAKLPDGFNYETKLKITLQRYANAIGLDVQDLLPLSGQALGTGAQSQVLNNKAKGKGLESWKQDFVHVLGQYVLQPGVTFTFSEYDLQDETAKATLTGSRATNAKTMIESGMITADKGTQYMVDLDELPEEFLTQPDQTPETRLTDMDNPTDQATEEITPAPGVTLGAALTPAPMVNLNATKTNPNTGN